MEVGETGNLQRVTPNVSDVTHSESSTGLRST